MKETELNVDPLSLTFTVNEENWEVKIPKSQTNIQYKEQLKLITQQKDYFVPLTVEETDDVYSFTFIVKKEWNQFSELKRTRRDEKLRALANIAILYPLLETRITFFLHPNNIVFNENLMPLVVYRGIRERIQPYKMTKQELLKQLKCLTIAAFTKKYSFDELYNGSLENITETRFEREVNAQGSVQELLDFLQQSYQKEQKQMASMMQLVPKRRFQLFKQLSIWVTVAAVLLIGLLIYAIGVKVPYQDRVIAANNEFLANNYGEVIHTLQDENMEKLPYQAKYILAYSYVKVEPLSDTEKETIMKNISLKSDKHYLLYWIYNGLGDFDSSIDKAKYMDDPQLIIYGLIKKIEQVKNDPELTGAEKDEEVRTLQEELDNYTDEYELLDEEDEAKSEDVNPVEPTNDQEKNNADVDKKDKKKDTSKGKSE